MLEVVSDNSEETAQAIERGLNNYNRKAASGLNIESKPVNVAVRDTNGEVCGGIVARVNADTLYVNLVWLDERLRGTGQGRAMMQKVEDEGRKLGARVAWLLTLSFQARPFYEKLGYRLFGEMPVDGGTHRRYFMQKDL
jgi:GNAT superfamily N-acetyltransferase